MERIGIVDLGSNSARLIVMNISSTGAYNLVYHQKETVRLSEGLEQDNLLKPDAMQRAIETLKIFGHMCKLFEVDKILAVATAAVRNAINGHNFVERVEQETGIYLDIISGEKEAFLGYLGVINTLDITDGLIFDLGGGSTEITLVKDRKSINSYSLPFGAVNMTERFKTNDKISEQTRRELYDFIFTHLSKLEWLKNINVPLIGIGGTARNIAKMEQKRKNYPLPKLHNYRLGLLSFKDLYDQLIKTNYNQRRKIPGLNSDRADIVVAGSTIINCLFDYTGSNRLIVSGCGVREGLFFDYYLPRVSKKNVLDDILMHSANNILLFYKGYQTHAHHVAFLADKLFDGLQSLHRLNWRNKDLLLVAALLHDIGITINYYDHARHSAYLIENARLFGLTHREQMLASAIAGWHNSPATKYFRYRLYNELLDDVDWQVARRAALMLALAEALDTTQMSIIKDIEIKIYPDSAQFILSADCNPAIELKAVEKHFKWFKKEFGIPLSIELK